MILSSEWLKQYISLPKSLSPVLDKLTHAGFEVEEVRERGVVFELNISPNRPDCMSFLGIARELSALLKKQIRFPKINIKEGERRIKELAKVFVKDSKKCPRYMGRLIQGVRVGASPAWLRQRLESVGQRSINNVVDITNYVLMECGQPLHAFDADHIEGHTIVVRTAKAGETIVTLDGEKRVLTPHDLVIADLKKPIALAGIMGGSTSEVSSQTIHIFLESAYFSPEIIRMTSKRFGLSSESSKRFERGGDIEGVRFALDRAAQLISEVAGGEICRGFVDVYPKKNRKRDVALKVDRLTQYLGYWVSVSEIKGLLKPLGFVLKSISSSKEKASRIGNPRVDNLRLVFEVPSHRVDVREEVDLIEEVARLKGYDRLPAWEPIGNVHLEQIIEIPDSTVSEIRASLVGAGLSEVVNYSFYSPSDLTKIGWKPSQVTKIQNPLGEEYSVMRPSLVPSLLKNLEFNLRHQTERVRIFELRNVYDEKGGEKKMLAGLISGFRYPLNWSLPETGVDFFDLKAVVVLMMSQLFLEKDIKLRPLGHSSYFQPGIAAELLIDGQVMGGMGKIHTGLLEAYDIKQAAYLFECDVSLMQLLHQKKYFSMISKYPSIKRDLSILIPLNVELSYELLYETLRQEGGGLLEEIQLFDLYQGTSIPEGYRSMAFSLRYHSHERTLTDEEIHKIHAKVCHSLEAKWQIKIR